MAKLDTILRRQLPGGMTLVKPDETPVGFGKKLEELQREIQYLQLACTRLMSIARRRRATWQGPTSVSSPMS